MNDAGLEQVRTHNLHSHTKFYSKLSQRLMCHVTLPIRCIMFAKGILD